MLLPVLGALFGLCLSGHLRQVSLYTAVAYGLQYIVLPSKIALDIGVVELHAFVMFSSHRGLLTTVYQCIIAETH